MAIKTSTGLRNAMLSGDTLKATMDLGFIKLYSGTPPATADAAVTGTLLCTISNNSTGTGLLFDTAAAAGILAKKPSETWSGVNANSGTATYYRHIAASGDDGTLSTTQPRIQGTIATVGADMDISNPVLVAAAPQALDTYSVALPTA